MLRSGKLIQTDITKHLQEALAACGWEEAGNLEQQDTSEAFGFITEKLQLPLLTLEMDIFHEGKGEAADDHRLIKERLLEVAVPSDAGEGRTLKLEDCLEEHFNTRVEVVRRLERRDTLQRSNTKSSVRSGLTNVLEGSAGPEHAEVSDSPSSQVEQSSKSSPKSPSSPTFPVSNGRARAPSIIRRRIIEEEAGESSDADPSRPHSSLRKGSIRKEVLMPAWQFFRIIRPTPIYSHLFPRVFPKYNERVILIGDTAWYTADVPSNDAQVAAHFSKTRPVLGICLKRYTMNARGEPSRQNTAIDIPLQIALPHFIQDDDTSENGPLFGNFNLVLQSVVCHRGKSVHSGHYISLVRGTSQTRDNMPSAPDEDGIDLPPEYSEDNWIKFDDLATERVSSVDITKAMAEEMPYLLFYQVQPLFEDSPEMSDSYNRPPSYEDSGIGLTLREPTPVITSHSEPSNQAGYFNYKEASSEEQNQTRVSFSDDVDRPRKSLTLPDGERRSSLTCTDASTASINTISSTPATPGEDTSTAGRLSRAASRFARSNKSKSRPSSHVDETRNSMSGDRITATLSRLNLMRSSKEPLRPPDISVPDLTVSVTSVTELEEPVDAPAEAEAEPRVIESSVGGIGRSKSKRIKNKTPEDKGQGHHHHLHKGKGRFKESGEQQDRECVLM
ncbi:MAG: hypothetical protein M1818_000052 [Claussenomyces sp. TS43310]|nr:MAG: hypothetical protein M1818_000052 [Claussenomyces sp. TS43310]